jgi:hypothetical protein
MELHIQTAYSRGIFSGTIFLSFPSKTLYIIFAYQEDKYCDIRMLAY